jgi:hypothetical protein
MEYKLKKIICVIIMSLCISFLQLFAAEFIFAAIHINTSTSPLWPVPGQPKICSNFGVNMAKNGGNFHDHIDIYAPCYTSRK